MGGRVTRPMKANLTSFLQMTDNLSFLQSPTASCHLLALDLPLPSLGEEPLVRAVGESKEEVGWGPAEGKGLALVR